MFTENLSTNYCRHRCSKIATVNLIRKNWIARIGFSFNLKVTQAPMFGQDGQTGAKGGKKLANSKIID